MDWLFPDAGGCGLACGPSPHGEDGDRLNRRLLELVQRDGDVFLTGTELAGRFVLRACIVNFRTTEADLDLLLNVLAEAGQRVLQTA